MDWRLKALAFRALDLPGGAHAHYFLQRHVTRNWPRRPATLDALCGIARRVTANYARYVGATLESVLEIGAGRDLAVPLGLIRIGVRRVIASDVTRLAKLDLVRHAADHILTNRISPLRSWADVERLGIDYRAPDHLRGLTEKVDCSCSNEVLEHVPPDQLVELLASLRAVTGGITTHSIDYSDHYARSDPSVSRLNFLRYSDREWQRFNSGMQYVNRLRHSDYLRLFRQAGFTIIEETSELRAPPADLTIAEQFRHYDPDDLYAIKGRIVAR